MRFIVLSFLLTNVLSAQAPVEPPSTQSSPIAADSVENDSAVDSANTKSRRGAQLLIPAGSLFLPGLGQYLYGETKTGLGLTATTIAGYALTSVGDPLGDTWDGDFPRKSRDQLAETGFSIAFSAGALSAWDSFHSAVPALQGKGKYKFLTKRESVGDLVSAPFDSRFLRRWTTWVDLAQTVAIGALVLSDRKSGVDYVQFRGNDAAYSASASLNAAVSEEALFRGWMLPVLHQQTGQRFWIANGLQAGVFGAAHLPDAGWYAAVIGGWAAWEGWIVKRNEWSVRESIFHHFWYDAVVVTAAMLTEKKDIEVKVSFPTLSF